MVHRIHRHRRRPPDRRLCHSPQAGTWVALSLARKITNGPWRLTRSASIFPQPYPWELTVPALIYKTDFAGGVERFCRSDRTFAVTSADWDRDALLLGTAEGSVDLRTGNLRAANPADRITNVAGVAPAPVAKCPLWLAFLDQTTGSDTQLIRFLQQWCGYCLTGDTREHALVFVYGPGGNGKSVFLNTVTGILADYATVAAMDTFAASPTDRHPTDLAMLRGARLV
ncbi:MAG: DNA primase, partial [Rhizobiales bacterium]|nr:DNA primase [Hyphomicrobiales bacterium]